MGEDASLGTRSVILAAGVEAAEEAGFVLSTFMFTYVFAEGTVIESESIVEG